MVTKPSPFHALLIVGGTNQTRSKEANLAPTNSINHLVLQPLEGKTVISIEQVRKFKRWVQIKPRKGIKKTVFIPQAQKLSVPAQNSLLKTLEEPPKYAKITMTAPSTTSLLPTVVSRCAVKTLKPQIDVDTTSETHQKAVEGLIEILQKGQEPSGAACQSISEGRGEGLAWTSRHEKLIREREVAIEILEAWFSALRDIILLKTNNKKAVVNTKYVNELAQLTKCYNHKWLGNIKQINKLIKTTNVNTRMALEVFLLELW